MKKILCLVLALALSVSIFAACGKNNNESTDTPATEETGKPIESSGANAESSEANSENSEPAEIEYDLPEPSENKEVVTEEKAPEVYLVIGSEDNAASISYHLKDCKLLKGGEAQKVAWEMVKTLGFHQCPECNPPRYEGYIE